MSISLDEIYKRASALIAALAASLAVLKRKRTKFKNLRKKQKDLIFQKLIYTACKSRGGTVGREGGW